MSENILSLILEARKKKIEVLKSNHKAISALAVKAAKPRNFAAAIGRSGKLSLIAELKQASPSSGIIRKDFDLEKIAKIYQASGANALSVLTEEEFFLGKLNYIEAVKKVVDLPVLRKDFILDEIQVLESRAAGADAILLIMRLLDDKKFQKLYARAKELGMDVLTEIYSEKELRKAIQFGVNIIGINTRNLSTLAIDSKRVAKLSPFIPAGIIKVAESGIKETKDALLLKGLGMDAMLIGSAFIKAQDIAAKVNELHIDA